MRERAASVAEHAEAVRVVDDQPRVESLREQQELGQRRDVAVHAEHRVGGDELARRPTDAASARVERADVAMRGSGRVRRATAARRRSGTRGSAGRRRSRRRAPRARSGSRGWRDSRWKTSARARRRTARRRRRARPRARRAAARGRRSRCDAPAPTPQRAMRVARGGGDVGMRWRAPGNRCWRTRAARGRRRRRAAPAPSRRSAACAQGRGRGAARARARAQQSPAQEPGTASRRIDVSDVAAIRPRQALARLRDHAGTRPSLANSARSASTSGLPVVSSLSP